MCPETVIFHLAIQLVINVMMMVKLTVSKVDGLALRRDCLH